MHIFFDGILDPKLLEYPIEFATAWMAGWISNCVEGRLSRLRLIMRIFSFFGFFFIPNASYFFSSSSSSFSFSSFFFFSSSSSYSSSTFQPCLFRLLFLFLLQLTFPSLTHASSSSSSSSSNWSSTYFKSSESWKFENDNNHLNHRLLYWYKISKTMNRFSQDPDF